MRPFFKHYGAKWRLSAKLPPPRLSPIIEPFAGGAGFSTRYGENKPVFLYDTCVETVSIWEYLLTAEEEDILSLPVDPVHRGEHVFTLDIPYPAALLIQRWLTPQGSKRTYRMPPAQRKLVREGYSGVWGEEVKVRIAGQLEGVRLWEVRCSSYSDVVVREAHWHIDPPYQHNLAGADYYRSRGLDYDDLANWCHRLPGDVTVHEQFGADWLPFRTLDPRACSGCIQGSKLKRAHEVFWSKRKEA